MRQVSAWAETDFSTKDRQGESNVRWVIELEFAFAWNLL